MVAEQERRASELAACFAMSFPAVSKHIKVLERARLVKRDVDGRIHRFTFNEKTMKQAHDWIATYQQFWSDRLDSLETFLQKNE